MSLHRKRRSEEKAYELAYNKRVYGTSNLETLTDEEKLIKQMIALVDDFKKRSFLNSAEK